MVWFDYRFSWLAIDGSRVYSYGILGDIKMARNNSRCASNIYVGLSDVFKPDYKFAGDTEFYLSSFAAAQSFYLAFNEWERGMGWLNTLWPLGPLIELVGRGANLTMVISSLLLFQDMKKLQLSPLESELKKEDAKC